MPSATFVGAMREEFMPVPSSYNDPYYGMLNCHGCGARLYPASENADHRVYTFMTNTSDRRGNIWGQCCASDIPVGYPERRVW